MLIHTSEIKTDTERAYLELHREGGYTIEAEVDFYFNDRGYTDAQVSVLAENHTWTELAEYSVHLWYDSVAAAPSDEARMDIFKIIIEYLLSVAREALGLTAPTDAALGHPTEIPAR